MPRNIVASRPAITVSVAEALRHSGLRNAGTPLEIASTPVRAVVPDPKARRARNSVSSRVPGASKW